MTGRPPSPSYCRRCARTALLSCSCTSGPRARRQLPPATRATPRARRFPPSSYPNLLPRSRALRAVRLFQIACDFRPTRGIAGQIPDTIRRVFSPALGSQDAPDRGDPRTSSPVGRCAGGLEGRPVVGRAPSSGKDEQGVKLWHVAFASALGTI